MNSSALYKGSLQTIILKLLSERERMYGYELTQEVKRLTQGKLKITEGALYPMLHKLESKGLLETEQQKVDGRWRKYYRLTNTGIKETTTQIAALKQAIENLELILTPIPKFN